MKLTARQDAVLRRATLLPEQGQACTTWLHVPPVPSVTATYATVRQLEAKGLMARYRPDYTTWAPTRAGRELIQALDNEGG